MMGWRIIVIEKPCKLAYKNNYLLIRAEEDSLIFIPEIDMIIINTQQIIFTGIIICELIKNKVKIVFCDEKHNPHAELVGYYTCFNTSKKVLKQVNWKNDVKQVIFTKIIEQKIKNQSNFLKHIGKTNESNLLESYIRDLKMNDLTNREGHSAKVFFNALFGLDFTRESADFRNSALNYGYSILLSYVNREIVKNGYITQLGIHHCNEYNNFNLSCDLMEPFRVIIDEFVYNNPISEKLSPEYKHRMLSIFSKRVKLEREYYLSDAIEQIIRNNLSCLSNEKVNELLLYEY